MYKINSELATFHKAAKQLLQVTERKFISYGQHKSNK